VWGGVTTEKRFEQSARSRNDLEEEKSAKERGGEAIPVTTGNGRLAGARGVKKKWKKKIQTREGEKLGAQKSPFSGGGGEGCWGGVRQYGGIRALYSW